MLKIFKVICITCTFGLVYAETNFYVDPTRVVLTDTKTSVQLTVHNNFEESQPIQVKTVMLTQILDGNKLTESNPSIMGHPQVAITPQIMSVAPKSTKPIRLLALSQLDNDEISYRIFIRSITPRAITSSGTTMELGFGIPVYVLPKNIHQSANYLITKKGTNYSLIIKNTGNVHLNVNTVILYDSNNQAIQTISTPGAILSGKERVFTFKMKNNNNYSEFKAEIKQQDLINFTNEVTHAQTIKIVTI
ncbi:MAG: Pili and flagellar-assembly chaperone, PapD N-terminal domain [Bacteroidota bacterium]|jgi:P pilus assembly chaperone PapD